MFYHDFYNNEVIPKTENMTLQKILAELHDFDKHPTYLKDLLFRWPLPPFIQSMKISPQDVQTASLSLEATKRIFKLCRIILTRMGINITPEGDVVLVNDAPEGILLMVNKDKYDRTTRDHAIHFLADVVTNLFCIGCFRIAAAVGNTIIMLCGILAEQKAIFPTCAGYVTFQFQLCNTIQNFFLAQEKKYFAEQSMFEKLLDPISVKCHVRGRTIGFCHHGILVVVTSGGRDECLFSKIRELRDYACQ